MEKFFELPSFPERNVNLIRLICFCIFSWGFFRITISRSRLVSKQGFPFLLTHLPTNQLELADMPFFFLKVKAALTLKLEIKVVFRHDVNTS